MTETTTIANERALSGAKMANMTVGRPNAQEIQSRDRISEPTPSRPRLVSQSEAAKIAGVSVPTIAAQRLQEVAAGRGCADLWEAEERLAYAETAVSIYSSELLAAREEERAARLKVSEAASKYGRAWRELAEAREALQAARAPRPLTSAFPGEL